MYKNNRIQQKTKVKKQPRKKENKKKKKLVDKPKPIKQKDSIK